jgi:nitrate reductase NapE component
MLCYQQGLPIELDEQGGSATLRVGSQVLPLGGIGTLTTLQFAPHDPVVHEYQLDGTDSTNNLTLDPAYLDSIASSPYYRFQSWMRNLDGTSRWSDLRVYRNDHLLISEDWPENGTFVSLRSTSPQSSPSSSSLQTLASTLRLQVQLRRPETPMTLNLITEKNTTIQITLDRNNRKIEVTRQVQGESNVIANSFFPVDVLPFAAMVMDTLIRTMLWAGLVLLTILGCEVGIVFMQELWRARFQKPEKDQRETVQTATSLVEKQPGGDIVAVAQLTGSVSRVAITSPSKMRHSLTHGLHPIALVTLVGSLGFTTWIAYVQYHAEPHIYDASAYFFAAKMYAIGRLSVPIPPAIDRFPGPFMVQLAGQWFGQYTPGTALTLVPGIWLGIPWLVEPVLGTLALLGIGLVATRLYDRHVATLAVILGALSPFYSYLTASYLSHAIALFYLVWGAWALVRFTQGEAKWNLPLAALFFGMAGLTRDQVVILFVVIVLLGVLLLSWRRLRTDHHRWIIPGILFLAIILAFVGIDIGFNALLTHNPWVTPRSLFLAGDHWGFGPDIGFYGQHTVAAGLVNLDELLTILAIDLYGWPFYLTLAFIPLPFLTRQATRVDWFCLISTTILMSAYIGYFYHGIYLGPRYFFETLPFLLILTARGILTLAATGTQVGCALRKHWYRRSAVVRTRTAVSIPTLILVTLLVLCNLLYFLPRQVELHQNYSGLPSWYHIDLTKVYNPPLHNALVVTGDYTVYQLVLFPLNDPLFHGDVIYAWANSASDYAELRAAFPGRLIFRLDIAPDGSVQYTALTS